ncbi:MAG: hypothetical protein ACPIA7_08360, partial [Akkermansiaceae bacterium]
GNLSMLVSCPSREHHLAYFRDSEDELPGSGMLRLFKHLRKLYTASHVKSLSDEYESLKRHNEDTQPFWERYTRRIGTPRKFAEGINEAFARWIKKNRPQLYDSLEGNVCRKDINQTYLDQLQKQRDVAFSMDEDAILHDDGAEPQKYWSGYADAMRGNEDALDGLRELMRSPAKNATEIKELGYGIQRAAYLAKNLGDLSRKRRKSSRSIGDRGKKNTGREIDQLAEHIPAIPSSPPQPMSRASKLKLMSVVMACLIVICGLGAIIAIKEWRKYRQNTQLFDAANAELMMENQTKNESPPIEEQEPDQTEVDAAKEKQAQIIARLYEPEARQLANDFGMSTNPDVRLSMCRYKDQISKRLDHYPKQMLTEAASEVKFLDVADLGGIMAARFLAKFPNNKSRLICVVSTENGLRVDWDCYARYNSLAIPLLLRGDMKSAELRVFVERSDYYNFSYRDDTRWSSFILKSPDSEELIYAYSLKQTTTGKLLDAALSGVNRGKSVQVTLQVSSRSDSHKRKQFTIDRIYAFGWLKPEIDIEDTYRSKLESIIDASQ